MVDWLIVVAVFPLLGAEGGQSMMCSEFSLSQIGQNDTDLQDSGSILRLGASKIGLITVREEGVRDQRDKFCALLFLLLLLLSIDHAVCVFVGSEQTIIEG